MHDGKEPIAFDHDCREGICGSCGFMINGQAARSRARDRDVPAAHAQVPRRRAHHHRAVARRRFPDGQGPDRRPQRVRSHHRVRAATSASVPAVRPMATSSRSRSRSPTRRWTRPRASAAARASPRARTAPRSCSPRRRCSTSTCCRRVRPSAGTAPINMVETMETYFGSCTNHRECEAACPKEISIDFIALMNKDYRQGAAQAAPTGRANVPLNG